MREGNLESKIIRVRFRDEGEKGKKEKCGGERAGSWRGQKERSGRGAA